MTLTQKILKRLFPSLTMTRKQSLNAIKSLQRKLNQEREETKYWKQRANKVEDLVSRHIRDYRQEAMEHDGLSYRVF